MINDKPVCVYSQDSTILGGSIGEVHALKIAAVYDLAVRIGAPVIGLVDSAGLRLQEGVDALNAFAQIYANHAKASGVVPQIMAVFGNCGGGLALAASMSDFTMMEENARMFVNGVIPWRATTKKKMTQPMQSTVRKPASWTLSEVRTKSSPRSAS